MWTFYNQWKKKSRGPKKLIIIENQRWKGKQLNKKEKRTVVDILIIKNIYIILWCEIVLI